ncbi:Dihydropyrimidinase-related protein 3 [Halotydeus destructor]|nr:Dihydropyrimidinase-related protein 3 [Halotydeus destructor]
MSTESNAKKIPIHLQSSQHRILIKGGKVVNDDSIVDSDVYIEEGVIRQVGPNLIVPGGCRVIEAKGQYVIPGGIDPHTHFEYSTLGLKSVETFYSGTKAAIAGGTTTIIDFVIAPDVGLLEGYDRWRSMADGKVCCDYSLHVAVTRWKDGVTEKEMEVLGKERGVNSFKCFMAYKDTFMISDTDMIKVFDVCRRLGALPMVHAENGLVIDHLSKKLLKLGVNGPEGHLQSRPEEVEAEATHRAITYADQVGSPLYVVHVMSKSAAEEVARAKSRGAVVYGEALAAGLGSDGTHYFNRCWRHAAGHVLSPPLRPDKNTPEHLVNMVAVGLLDSTGSDHAVFNSEQKAVGEKDFTKIPNGVNGVEERMSVVWEKGVKTGKMTPSQFVAATSSNAARIFNLYPRKGKIAPGSDADVVVWGRKPRTITAEKHQSLADFNIFEGTNVEFNPLYVITNGRVALDDDGLHVIQGSGRFIPTPLMAPHVFSRIRARELNMGPLKVDRSAQAEPKAPLPAAPAVGGDRNGATPPRKSSVELQLDTKLTELRVNTDGQSSPRSSGSMTPTGFFKTKTGSGVRNQQDSGFKITGEQVDDERGNRASIKVHNPPGGKSSGLW